MSCIINSLNYAKNQNTIYDSKNNQMLYGISSNLKVSGVSDGTCNQINPLMYNDNNKCSTGAAGANPCYDDNNKYIETFSNLNCGCDITYYIGLIFLSLILLLFLNINYIQYKENQ